MGLEEYKKKRDFSQTPEPEASYHKNKGQLRFVIQRHQASRLHYDLRLEMEGVLKSWAVPKGPSMNPADKRLSIQTEDHPIKYLSFHGVIPKGNYGAGKMTIWDEGIYEPAYGGGEASLLSMLEEGNLKLRFHGRKVQGTFALVRTRRGDQSNQWLLIKKDDEYATDLSYDAENLVEEEAEDAEAKVHQLQVNELIKPMLATKASEIFNKANWIYELKWDGYRAIANINKGKVDFYSRNGISFKSKFASIYENLKTIPHDVILDGEVVALNEEGLPVFQNLQNYQRDPVGELRYYVFDLLFLNGHTIMHLPLLERKSLLTEVIEDIPQVYYCDHIDTMGKTFYQQAVDAGMEGVIAKKADSEYIPGSRSENWLKIKAFESQEALICGYTDPQQGNAPFGSLILGMNRNDRLTYIGSCGTGFDTQSRKELFDKFQELKIEECPFEKKPNLKGRKPTWLRPELVCEVRFTEWTSSGSMRHPSYKGLRFDKTPVEIDKEEVVNVPVQKASSKSTETLEIDGIAVPISNLEKVYWPESGFRKFDLIDYYLQVAEYMLPFLIDRPQNMHRHPNGITAEGFYQKDTAGIFPHWLETVKVTSRSSEKEIEYILCQNQASLLYMANLGCIEINPWNSRKESLDAPDFTVIDIDPSEKTKFSDVIEVAQVAKEVLDQAGITGYPKTSGSSGIHIYIPLGAKYSYDEARDFTKILCYFIMDRLPGITSMERNVKKRQGKIYLDFLQNRRGQTLAAPYCARPKPGATVSAPLEWKEINQDLSMHDFTIKTMPARIAEKPHLFRAVLEEGIDIAKALENLG